MQNVYETIYQKKLKNPEVPLSQLCREGGKSYQSYRNWVKRYIEKLDGKKLDSYKMAAKIKVTVLVSARELANLVVAGVREVPIPIENIIRGLPEEEKRTVAEVVGSMRLEEIFGRLSEDPKVTTSSAVGNS